VRIKPGEKTWYYGSPGRRCIQEVLSGMGTLSNSLATAKYALSHGEGWQSSRPSRVVVAIQKGSAV